MLLLLSMYDRSYSLYVRDGAQSMIGNYAQQQLEDSFLDYLGDDDWYGGFHAYLTTCADMMQQASEGHAVRKPLGKVIFPALLVGCGQQQTDAPGNDAPDQPALADGVYTADFNTDSSMFHANETCDGKGVLTVKDGQMTIHLSLIHI